MSMRRLSLFVLSAMLACAPNAPAQSNTQSSLTLSSSTPFKAKYLRITIPRGSVDTPVQRLNRAGVQALLKQKYEAAEQAFNKAYLYDPTDPVTLNNLGYVSELQGELDHAEKFYNLAAEQGCYAIIERSSVRELKGKPMIAALGIGSGTEMRVNSMNVLAMELLSEGRAFEAHSVLEQALAFDPKNAFTLNNLGAAEEAMGDLVAALEHYEQASTSGPAQKIVVTEDRAWRGKIISTMASKSAKALRSRMQGMDPDQVEAMMLSIRGVSAMNHNNWPAARQDFVKAYSLQPTSAFTLNNYGYVEEHDGDLESASYHYGLAQKADDAGARVGMATDAAAHGHRLTSIAEANVKAADIEQEAYRQTRRRKGTIKLIPRNNESEHKAPEPQATPPAKPGKNSPDPAPLSPQ